MFAFLPIGFRFDPRTHSSFSYLFSSTSGGEVDGALPSLAHAAPTRGGTAAEPDTPSGHSIQYDSGRRCFEKIVGRTFLLWPFCRARLTLSQKINMTFYCRMLLSESIQVSRPLRLGTEVRIPRGLGVRGWISRAKREPEEFSGRMTPV